jgi:DNA-binding NarL/FixJ family response regulator
MVEVLGERKNVMSISISSIPTTVESGPKSAAASVPGPKALPPVTHEKDVVELAESQQVYQLYNQGEKISDIATSLRLSVEAVNSYLGISAGK